MLLEMNNPNPVPEKEFAINFETVLGVSPGTG
jgi:hypothetical protein